MPAPGTLPALSWIPNGAVKRTLDSIDIPLGFLPGHKFSCSEPFILEPGEILALLTDGITEAERPDQDQFGVERALAFIQAHRAGKRSGDRCNSYFTRCVIFQTGCRRSMTSQSICKVRVRRNRPVAMRRKRRPE